MLAFYSPYPHGKDNSIEYKEKDLLNPEVVEQLFNYCQILE